jgi:asparagine synthase (glutamine-hydrolysing)
MCGIAGILQFPSSPDAGGLTASVRAKAELMVSQLHHRGPDACGVVTLGTGGQPAVALGHTRLAILDLSDAGRQPMASSDGSLSITFNGEIYNFRELRNQLEQPIGGWRSHSDTEVILAAYARWGPACVHHLRGMFAFAIWDERLGELFIARDRLGIKPLYCSSNADRFLFASEVRALLATGMVSRQLDPVALDQYLTYQSVPAPRTLLQDVHTLPPGSWMRVGSNGHVTTGVYWDLLGSASYAPHTQSEVTSRRRVGELLRESVALHLVSDVPVGVFLSGGIDSSAIVALVSEAGGSSQTFSLGFAERSFDETHHARRVASRFHSEHTEILLKQEDILQQLPEALAAMDQPTGDAVNTYLVAGAVHAAGIKVALSGLGGDELFAGYPSFARLSRSARLLRAWGRLPYHVRALTAASLRAVGPSSVAAVKLAATLATNGELANVFPVTRQVLSRAQREAMLEATWRERADADRDPYAELLQAGFARTPSAGLLARISYAESRTYMHDLLLRDTDQMSMSHSLEVRVPLLDHVLAEYVVGLPDAHKRPGSRPKRLLVESLGGLLPDDIVHRPKQGFTLPFDPWMRSPLRDFCQARMHRLGSRGIFHPESLLDLWQGFLSGEGRVSWSRVWVLVALDEWLERHAC